MQQNLGFDAASGELLVKRLCNDARLQWQISGKSEPFLSFFLFRGRVYEAVHTIVPLMDEGGCWRTIVDGEGVGLKWKESYGSGSRKLEMASC